MAEALGYLDPNDEIGKRHMDMIEGKRKTFYSAPWIESPNPVADQIAAKEIAKQMGSGNIGDYEYAQQTMGMDPSQYTSAVTTSDNSAMSQAIANKYQKQLNKDVSNLLGGIKINAPVKAAERIQKSAQIQKVHADRKKRAILDSWEYEVKRDAIIKERERQKRAAEASFISAALGIVGAGIGFVAGGPAGAVAGGMIGSGVGGMAAS